jgi:hypothetical protein
MFKDEDILKILNSIPAPKELPYLIKVRIYWEAFEKDGSRRFDDVIMFADQVTPYLNAKLELHHEPGVNPYNGNKCVRIRKIQATKLRSPEGYWHTQEGLGKVVGGRQAQVMAWNWIYAVTVWRSEGCIVDDEIEYHHARAMERG